MGRELQPTFDVTREIPTTGHAASRPRPTFPKLRVRPDGTLVISPLVTFCRESADVPPAVQTPLTGPGFFSCDPLVLVGAACALFWLGFWLVVLA